MVDLDTLKAAEHTIRLVLDQPDFISVHLLAADSLRFNSLVVDTLRFGTTSLPEVSVHKSWVDWVLTVLSTLAALSVGAFAILSWLVYRRMADTSAKQAEILLGQEGLLQKQTELQEMVFKAQYVRDIVVTLVEQWGVIFATITNSGKKDTILEVVLMALTPPHAQYKYVFPKFSKMELEYGDDVPVTIPIKTLLKSGFELEQPVMCHIVMTSGEMYMSKTMMLRLNAPPEPNWEPTVEDEPPAEESEKK